MPPSCVALQADSQSGTQMFSSCRPLTRMQEQNVNKLAGVAACLLLRCTTAHDLLELNVRRNALLHITGMTKLVIRRCGRAPAKHRSTAKFGPIRRIQSPAPQCNAGRKDGERPTTKRTGKDAVEGADLLLGLGLLFFKVRWALASASCSFSPNSVLSKYVEGAYLLLGLGLQFLKGRSVEAFLVSVLSRQGLKSRQS